MRTIYGKWPDVVGWMKVLLGGGAVYGFNMFMDKIYTEEFEKMMYAQVQQRLARYKLSGDIR